jgi:hypothetical protein
MEVLVIFAASSSVIPPPPEGFFWDKCLILSSPSSREGRGQKMIGTEERVEEGDPLRVHGTGRNERDRAVRDRREGKEGMGCKGWDVRTEET